MLGLRFCAPTGDETDFEWKRGSVSVILSHSKAKSERAERGKQKPAIRYIFLPFEHPISFPSIDLSFAVQGPQNCVSSNLFSQ
jgi:hypothetical protein